MIDISELLICAAVAQCVRAFAPQAEEWVFESQPRQSYVVKTGSDSSISKHSAIGGVLLKRGTENGTENGTE